MSTLLSFYSVNIQVKFMLISNKEINVNLYDINTDKYFNTEIVWYLTVTNHKK